MIDLPSAFCERMQSLLSDAFKDFKKALEEPTVRAIRVNALKYSKERLEAVFGNDIEPMGAVDGGYLYKGDERIGNHPLHHGGAFYVQEPGAMAVVACAPIREGFKVLDLCASPGGKTTHAASVLGERGIIVSNEIIKNRCSVLLSNIERMGIKNSVVMNCDTSYLAKSYQNAFDLVIADAPCSGEGMFRKSEDALLMWSIENVKTCAERQRYILENGAKCVKNGGYLLYSTCTFSLEENEMCIDGFLSDHPEFRLVRVPREIEAISADGIAFEGIKCSNIEYARRFYPHIYPCEGQFAALLQKDGDIDEDRATFSNVLDQKSPDYLKITREDAKIIENFLDEVLDVKKIPEYTLRRDGVYLVSGELPLLKNHVFSCGVKLGEIIKGRLVPHHRFFMAYGNCFKNRIDLTLDDPRVEKYLRGEEIPAPENLKGYCAVLCDGVTLGGAKVSSGIAKNHYPKGLRISGH